MSSFDLIVFSAGNPDEFCKTRLPVDRWYDFGSLQARGAPRVGHGRARDRRHGAARLPPAACPRPAPSSATARRIFLFSWKIGAPGMPRFPTHDTADALGAFTVRRTTAVGGKLVTPFTLPLTTGEGNWSGS